MPLFRYEVTDQKGKTLIGAMSAPDEPELRARLGARGYQVTKVASPQVKPGDGAPARRPGSAGPADKALFFRQFASLIRAGIAPFAALTDLTPRLSNPAIAQAAGEMRDAAQGGGRVSDVMVGYPALFPQHVVATVRAGETGGFLEIALDEIALEYEQELAFYKGTWLPKALVVQEVLALALAQPLFPTLFPKNQLGQYLLLAFVRNVPIAVAVVLLVRWLWRRLHTPGMSERRDRWTLGIPVFGDLSRQRSLAAFVRMLRRLYASGLMPINAWEGAANVVPNTILRQKLAQARDMMQQGVPLHEAFRNTGLFASEAEQLIATGVMAGEVIEMLDRIAEYYQNNVQRAVDSSRFWMYRLAISLFLAISGIVLIVLLKTYFQSIFDFTKDWV
jgi:type IV pilus assembly protein PilC